MSNYHFFERMERDIDWKHEYEKVEDIVCNEHMVGADYSYNVSLNSWISQNFRAWQDRQNYSSFEELREHLGFEIGLVHVGVFGPDDQHRGEPIKMQDYFLYSEMIMNIVYSLLHAGEDDPDFEEYSETDDIEDWMMNNIIPIFTYDINKAGFEFNKQSNGHILINQKNAAASVVAEHVKPSLADAIIEYNHYLLRGDIKRKKELLKIIADELEPQRTKLKGVNKTLENDFFLFVNKCNIRHNNLDPQDAGNYYSKLASLTAEEFEKVYDLIYEEGLMCFMTLEQMNRKTAINNVKALLS